MGLVLTGLTQGTTNLIVGGGTVVQDFGVVPISQISPVGVAATLFPPSADQATAYVRGLYLNLLDRNADAAGLQFWTSMLEPDPASVALHQLVVAGIWDSLEHRGIQVDDYYATFPFDSGPGGPMHFVQRLMNGEGEADIADEFRTTLGIPARLHPNADAFVKGLYFDVLSGSAGTAELSYWTSCRSRAKGKRGGCRHQGLRMNRSCGW